MKTYSKISSDRVDSHTSNLVLPQTLKTIRSLRDRSSRLLDLCSKKQISKRLSTLIALWEVALPNSPKPPCASCSLAFWECCAASASIQILYILMWFYLCAFGTLLGVFIAFSIFFYITMFCMFSINCYGLSSLLTIGSKLFYEFHKMS